MTTLSRAEIVERAVIAAWGCCTTPEEMAAFVRDTLADEFRGMTTQSWQAIDTAPDLRRVLVAGWQPPHGRTIGYWWWHEDLVSDGKALDHPDALLWCPIVVPPLPASPLNPSTESVGVGE